MDKEKMIQMEQRLHKKNIKIKMLNAALKEKKETIEKLRQTIRNLEGLKVSVPIEAEGLKISVPVEAKQCTCGMPDSWRLGVTCNCFSDDY